MTTEQARKAVVEALQFYLSKKAVDKIMLLVYQLVEAELVEEQNSNQ